MEEPEFEALVEALETLDDKRQEEINDDDFDLHRWEDDGGLPGW